MGLLDSLAGALSGAGNAPQVHPGMLDVVTTLLSDAQGGGLQGLVGQFEQQGLGHIVQSWIGNGQNLSITPEQVQAVLGEPHIQAVAQQLGLSPADVSTQLAALLPHAVDAATPDGQPAQGGVLSEALSAFAALRR